MYAAALIRASGSVLGPEVSPLYVPLQGGSPHPGPDFPL